MNTELRCTILTFNNVSSSIVFCNDIVYQVDEYEDDEEEHTEGEDAEGPSEEREDARLRQLEAGGAAPHS